MNIICSVHRNWIEMILSGIKTIEFRSMLPKDFKSGDKIYLYETSKNGGSKKIVGECEVDYIINVLSKDGKWPTFGCYPFLEYYFQNIKNDSYVANQYGKIKSEFENKVTKYKHGYVVKYAFSEENLDSLRKHGEVIDLWNIANFTVVQKYLKDIEKSDEYSKVVKEYLSMRKPSRYLLARIIDKIIINQNKEITIKLRIKNPELYLKELSTNKSAIKNY